MMVNERSLKSTHERTLIYQKAVATFMIKGQEARKTKDKLTMSEFNAIKSGASKANLHEID